jgi:hypothetical protein
MSLSAGTKLGPYEILSPLEPAGWVRCIAVAMRAKLNSKRKSAWADSREQRSSLKIQRRVSTPRRNASFIYTHIYTQNYMYPKPAVLAVPQNSRSLGLQGVRRVSSTA